MKKILLPTDYKISYTDKQLHILKTIANAYKSRIHVLNFSRGRDLTETENSNKEKLDDLLTDVNDAYYIFDYQEIPRAIDEFQNSTNFNLLMMINNKRSFLKNLFITPAIHKIGFQLKIPFLVIPTEM